MRTVFWTLQCAAFQMAQNKADTVILRDMPSQAAVWKDAQKTFSSSF